MSLFEITPQYKADVKKEQWICGSSMPQQIRYLRFLTSTSETRVLTTQREINDKMLELEFQRLLLASNILTQEESSSLEAMRSYAVEFSKGHTERECYCARLQKEIRDLQEDLTSRSNIFYANKAEYDKCEALMKRQYEFTKETSSS